MKTTYIDNVEEKIKIDTKFRHFVTGYISKIYTTRNNSILPYDINTEDVFEMLQDLNWSNDDKFVVFFNFEFLMCLRKLGVASNKITFIAPSKESYREITNYVFGTEGMKSILFDLSIYKKHQNRKQWKSYLMKKIGKLDEFIGVGNIPFTVNLTDSTNSKKIGNDFIKLMNQFQQSCYILPAKFDSKTFLSEIISNPTLSKIVFHKKKIFNISDLIYTCHVYLDKDNESNKFIYKDNVSDDFLEMEKSANVVLSVDVNKSFIRDDNKKTLADLWTRGNKSLNKLTNSGEYKVITALGNSKSEKFDFQYDNEENTTYGKYKVLMSNLRTNSIKKAGPEYSISYSIIAFEVDTKEQCEKLYQYMKEIDILQKIKYLATSGANTKTLFSKIPLPDGII
jgi:hypothetical protein